MLMKKYMKKIMLVGFIGAITSLSAKEMVHLFDLEKAMILYDIHGDAQLTAETNLTIEGKAKLRFKMWGEVRVEEEKGIVQTTGAIEHRQEVKRFEKFEKNKIITVDYINEQLLERKRGSEEKKEIILKKNRNQLEDIFIQKGKDEVAGVICDIWVAPGIKKCIYKGVLLKQESHVLGVNYVKVAKEIILDINTSDDECGVPDYPLHTFSLYKDNIKTKNIYKSENFCRAFKDAVKSVSDTNKTNIKTDKKERMLFINHLAQDIYKRQMVLLPQLLKYMKQTRVCLQTAENPQEANQCRQELSQIKEKFGNIDNDYIVLWDDKHKYIFLDKIEDKLIEIESRMPCIKRSKNITDLSHCLK